MVRTRRSAGLAQRDESDTKAKATPSSAGASSLDKPKRGRPSSSASRISSRDSVNSAPTASSSASGYSTPLTSNVTTPAPVALGSSHVTRQRLEINIPISSLPLDTVPADSKKALSRSIYDIHGSSKRKWDEVDDSDDDLSSPSADLMLARQLQEEELRQSQMGRAVPMTAARPAPAGSRLTKRAAEASFTKGKGPAPRRSTRMPTASGRGPTRAAAVVDSFDGDADEEVAIEGSDEELDVGYSIPDSEAESDFDLSPPPDDSSDESMGSTYSASRITKRPAPPSSKKQKQPTPIQNRKVARKPAAPQIATNHRTTTPADSSGEESGSEADLSSIHSASDDSESEDDSPPVMASAAARTPRARRLARGRTATNREEKNREKLESNHPYMKTLWEDFERIATVEPPMAEQPKTISRHLKPFQLQGLSWMKAMEQTDWKGGLLGDEMGLGKTIQAVSLVMSDWPAKQPSLVLAPPVALMQWMSEIESYTDGTLKTIVYHSSNAQVKHMTLNELKKIDVIIMSYNSLESLYRKQEKGFTRKDGIYKEKSLIHQLKFHRVILDEAHYIKSRVTMTSKACFALKTTYRWCLTGTPLQNRIGEFFSLVRFLKIEPFANYLCRNCPCSQLEWTMDDNHMCTECRHGGLSHVSVFNQELLNPIQKYGNSYLGAEAFRKLRLLTSKIMLRRQKKDHMDAMELPTKEVIIDRQFFGEVEKDFADSIMHSNQRRFDTYVSQGVVLNNYANIFGLLSQMRQVADHPDLILRKENAEGRHIMVCCICDDTAEDAVRSQCKHEFCRACVSSYVNSTDNPTCPRCHIQLSIDLEQPEVEQDQELVKKNSIINRIKMEQWTSSTKMEMLVHSLQKLRSDNSSHKSIVFSQFTGMLQLIEWRLRRAGITTVMLDGSMTPAQRAASIKHFMTNVDVECFLVSLKAGGVALNLTEASRVFIVDPWWNPAAEWQSADRVHRIGQTRPVVITRLCIEDSIESRVVLLQEKKTKMINSTVNSDDMALNALEAEDLQFLFRGS
ncbi:hypothetical protein RB595_007384 [Gaeumannomyces hyphopodioides]